MTDTSRGSGRLEREEASHAPDEQAGEPPAPARPRRKSRSFFAELPVLILVAFLLALLMKTFLVQAFYIPSSSMEPTLEVNDRVLVSKLTTAFREPRRGEVVVFREGDVVDDGTGAVRRFVDSLAASVGMGPPPEKDFIKRVIGLPGETLEMRDGVVYIDGEPLPEAPLAEGGYLSARHFTDFGPVEIGPDEYFMMGDNRPSSSDSRQFGAISGERIVGRAFVVIWPFERASSLSIAEYPAFEHVAVPSVVAEPAAP